jgi:hypothetical protein
MISEHTSGWKLHDWFFFIVLALRAFFGHPYSFSTWACASFWIDSRDTQGRFASIRISEMDC